MLLFGDISAEGVGKEDADNEGGEKDRCLKKGRVLKAMADPTRRAMRCMPGRNGNWAENFV